MNKLLLAVVLWVGLAGAGWTRTIEERLLAGLQDQGYVILELGYTFLGRLRIVAENDLIHREIVVNPSTGEVLRDYVILLSDMVPRQVGPQIASHGSRGVFAASKPGTVGAAASIAAAGTVTEGDTIVARTSVLQDMVGTADSAIPDEHYLFLGDPIILGPVAP